MTATTESPATLWWQHPFRMFQTNLREIDAGLDVERCWTSSRSYGANAWLISAGGILSYYPTDLPFQTRNPYLASCGNRRPDRRCRARRASARGLQAAGPDGLLEGRPPPVAEEHPEWCFVDRNGNPQVYSGLISVCPSGEYYQENCSPALDEVIDRYPVDGFFFNWFGSTKSTTEGVQRRLPVPQPASAPSRRTAARTPAAGLARRRRTTAAWRTFAAATLDDLTDRLRAPHRHSAPGCAAVSAGHGGHHLPRGEQRARARALAPRAPARRSARPKAHRPDVPVLVNSVAFMDMPYRLAGEEPDQFAQYLVQTISRGGNPSTYIMGTPEVIDYECLDIGREITRFHREHADVYDNLVSTASVALIQPDGLRRSPEQVASATSEFQGLYLALQERHIPFDVLQEGKIADRANGRYGLGQYQAIVLPDLGVLDDDVVAALDLFVTEGGAMVTTGSSGFDRDRPQLAASPVARRLASRETVESVRSLHLGVEVGSRTLPVPVIGAFHVVEPHPDAITGLPAISRAPYGPPEKCHGHLSLDHPGLVDGTRGGRGVVVMPWTVGRGYREVGLSAHRDLFVDILTNVAPGVALDDLPAGVPPLPEALEIVPGHSDAGYVIHLINRSGDADQRFRKPVTIRGAVLTIDSGTQRVTALKAGIELPAEPKDGRMIVQLPDIDLFEVLLVEFSPPIVRNVVQTLDQDGAA